MKLSELLSKFEAEADALERVLPDLEAQARAGALLAKRVPDFLLAQHRAARKSGAYVKELVERVGPLGGLEIDLLAARDEEMIEAFGDRLVDFVEETQRRLVVAGARAHTLREQTARIRAVEAQEAPAAAPESPAEPLAADPEDA